MKHIKITSKLRPALAVDDDTNDDATTEGNILDTIREGLGKDSKSA